MKWQSEDKNLFFDKKNRGEDGEEGGFDIIEVCFLEKRHC